jgi:hypothetical protein
MLEKQAASQAQTTNPLLMQQQMLSEALTSGLPAPHLSSTPKNNGLPTSAPFASGADVNMSELLAAAAAAAVAAHSAPMASAASDLAALQAAAAGAPGMRHGGMGHMMNPAASAGLPHMPPPGSLGGMHQRFGNNSNSGAHPYHAHAAAHKHQMGAQGMMPGHAGISAGRQASNVQAATAAAAIAAVAAQGGSGAHNGPGGHVGPATDSQGNILPLSRLQEIWSR